MKNWIICKTNWERKMTSDYSNYYALSHRNGIKKTKKHPKQNTRELIILLAAFDRKLHF